jgi:hypothetical protein
VPVLQQRRPVAELTGDLKVLRGPVEVALLTEDVREARSSTEVSSRKARTSSGCRLKTSSTR